MWSNLNALFTLAGLSLLSFTTATPVDAFTSLKCHCISFSPVHKPAPCQIPGGSRALNWAAARRLATHHQMKIQFATEDTVTRVLEVDAALPTSVLLSMGDEKPLPLNRAGSLESVEKIVCGIEDEVRQRWIVEKKMPGSESDWFAPKVVVSLILLIILYEVVEKAWTSIQSRYYSRYSFIRLPGDEKSLKADAESEVRDGSQEKAIDELFGIHSNSNVQCLSEVL